MVIDKVHGLQATAITLNERFGILARRPNRAAMRPRRRTGVNSFLNHSLNIRNQRLIEQIARKLEQHARRRALRQRMGDNPDNLRRVGSEDNLPRLVRANSVGNVGGRNQAMRQANGNLRRSASYSNLPGVAYRRRGGNGGRFMRGRMRGGVQNANRVRRVSQRVFGSPASGRGRGNRPGLRGRGQARGINRGGMNRQQPTNNVPTKEELDAQLDEYMSGSKAALDRELEEYMKNAPELDNMSL